MTDKGRAANSAGDNQVTQLIHIARFLERVPRLGLVQTSISACGVYRE